MDYYKDLSYYSRFHFENAQNIGFEGSYSAEKSSSLSEKFLEQLLKYLQYPVNTQRGGAFKSISLYGTDYVLGFSEIRVLGNDGKVFAAPDAVILEIAEGSYIPPAEFVSAVLNGVSPAGNEYQTFLSRYNPQCCWGAPDSYVREVVAVLDIISRGNLKELQNIMLNHTSISDLVAGNGSILNEAIVRNQEEIAVYLIESGFNLEKFEGVELLTAVECGMASIVDTLLEHGCPIKTDRPRNNPLFLAIGKFQNDIAEHLYNTRKDLVVTYNTDFMQNCNILQWTKMCKNQEFFDFMMQ